MRKSYTSEYVSEGHPDKVCDQISDAIVDECLKQDPLSRCAVESAIKTPDVYVFGELTTNAKINAEQIVKNTLKEIGYTDKSCGFDVNNCRITVNLSKQSPDIKQGVDENKNKKKDLGAGDQGIMFGYATDETPSFMPFTFDVARKLLWQLKQVRISNKLPYLRPDAKSQVTATCDNNKVISIDHVLLSSQHSDSVSDKKLHDDLLKYVIEPVLNQTKVKYNKKSIDINPSGRFVVGGPEADSGLTGRKNIVDTYGGIARHGGGALSGKDPTKVDRSASYYCRYVAKHIVAAGLAKKCEVAVAYIIGKSNPSMVEVETFGTAKASEQDIHKIINQYFDFRPRNIIDELELLRPIYKLTARTGHIGVDGYPWENLNKLAEVKKSSKKAKNGKVLLEV